MSEHTPGPWTVERRLSNGCEIVPRITCHPYSDRMCGWIADLVGAPYLGHQSTLPNAHLIAAAPELLDALIGLVQANEQWNAGVESVIGRHPEWSDSYLEVARAAIAKALTPSPPSQL